LTFTVVLPVHNEEIMLRKTLPSIKAIKPGEVVCVFDRCSDGSQRLCKAYLGEIMTPLIVRKRLDGNHLASLYLMGISQANHETVLLTQADVTLDPRISHLIHEAKNHVCSFRNLPYLGWNTLVTFTLSLMPKFRFSGVLAFPKRWTPLLIDAENDLEWDTQIARKVRELNLPYKYFKTACWNLRPYVRSRLWAIGETRRKLGRRPLGTLLYSVVRLQPEVFTAYLRSRGK